MATDLFERLAETPVPPPPVEFDRQVHQRLNYRLLIGQLLDLYLRCLPLVFLEFTRAMAGAVWFSLTGRYEARRKEGTQMPPADPDQRM